MNDLSPIGNIMVNLLFSTKGRIGRGGFWKGFLIIAVVSVLAVVLCSFLGMKFESSTEGSFNMSFDSAGSTPAALVAIVWVIFSAWAGICLGIKRYHDRDKSGAWILIQLVPVIGGLWYLVEAGFLAGTPGPNRFGPARRDLLAPVVATGF